MTFKKITLLTGCVCIIWINHLAAETRQVQSMSGIKTELSPEGLPEFKISRNAMPQNKWPCSIAPGMREVLNVTPLNISAFKLDPAQKGIGFMWPDKRLLIVQWNGTEWSIKKGPAPNMLKECALIKNKNIELAFYGTGIIIRDSGKLLADIGSGIDLLNVRMLIPEALAQIDFQNIEILQPALTSFFLNEARKNLQSAEKLFKANEEFIASSSLGRLKGKNLLKKWAVNYEMLDNALKNKEKEIFDKTEGWLPLVMANPDMRDRYTYFAQFSGLASIATGYMGDFYQKNWFAYLNGMPEYQFSTTLKERTERLVERAWRLEKTALKRGSIVKDEKEVILSAGFTGSLSTVPKDRPFFGEFTDTYSLELCRGEYESFQIILSAGNKPVKNISIAASDIQGTSAISKEAFRFYLIQYIRLVEPYPVNLPVTGGGDPLWPDPLQPLSPDERFSIQPHNNQPVWITMRAPENTPPGEYGLKIQIKTDGNISAELPVRFKVYDFAIGKNRLQSTAGFRHSEVAGFYGKDSYLKYLRNFEKVLLEHYCNPVDIYNSSPNYEDLKANIKDGMTLVTLPRYENLASPRPEMPDFTQLYASIDGKNFERIPADVKLVPQGDPQLTDWDLMINPGEDIKDYKFLKLHYSEIREWENRCPYSYFRVAADTSSLKMSAPDGKEIPVEKINFKKLDKNPGLSEKPEFLNLKKNELFTFDNVRDDQKFSSILIEKLPGMEIKNIRLVNSNRKTNIEAMTNAYKKFKELGEGKVILFSYGYDEAVESLNPQMLSALKTCKTLFPDVITGTTSIGISALPECYKYMDIICPNNSRFYMSEEKELSEKYGTQMWTYVGGGAYYPFPNFERVDQPLINSRAFFWPCVTFNLKGWLYWDINFWSCNPNIIHKWPEIWEIWSPTYSNSTNGMSALIYPGPDGTPIPSMRLEAMRDGIEDYNYFMIAEEMLANRKFDNPVIRKEIAGFVRDAKTKLSPGFSGFLEDPSEMSKIRSRVAGYIEKMNPLPLKDNK